MRPNRGWEGRILTLVRRLKKSAASVATRTSAENHPSQIVIRPLPSGSPQAGATRESRPVGSRPGRQGPPAFGLQVVELGGTEASNHASFRGIGNE